MSGGAGGRCYYLSDFSDESCPCEPTLEGWAEWLAKPSEEWGRAAPEADGKTFTAYVLRFQEDVIATPKDGEWRLSRDIAGLDFLAVRFGPGLGWSADDIVSDETELRDYLADCGEDGEINIAAAVSEPKVTVTFHAGPPPHCTAETVQ